MEVDFLIDALCNRSISFRYKGYHMRIAIYPFAWTFTHRLEILSRNSSINLVIPLEILKLILKAFEDREKEIFQVLRIVDLLNYRTSLRVLQDYFEGNKESLLKSIYFSIFRNRFGKTLRQRVKDSLEKLIELKVFSKDSKWAKKIQKIEDKIFWKRLLGNWT